MGKIIIRILIAFILAIAISSLGVRGNTNVLQTLFTVLGIVFSISMSLLVSFNLSKVLNKDIRKELRQRIANTRNLLLVDFIVSTVTLVTALIWTDTQNYTLWHWCDINVYMSATVIVAISLFYEIYNFRHLHTLNTDIEEAVIQEEIR